jgi:hypothetical protein
MPSLYPYILTLLVCVDSLLSSNPDSEIKMSHKALLLQEVGKPLVVGVRPMRHPGKNQLLVKVIVAGRK